MTGDETPPPDDSAWAPRATPAAPAVVPDLLAGYRDAVPVARGGDSVVYRAHQQSVDREVAIKVVELDAAGDAEALTRFRRELEITVRLGRQHPHIMTVLAVATTSTGRPCLVMDYCELGSLHDRLDARGPLAVSEVVTAGSVIADALAFAHEQGVLHRDVKPQNILVLPTSYVLADFGLARAVDAGHSSSLERFSYRHAAPQILDGEKPTVADDVYSLGSTLFTLLDGRAPFAADDPDEDSALSYLRRARTEQPRELTRDDVPAELRAIVTRCLSRRRDDRFETAAQLRDALDAVPTESRNWAPGAAPTPVTSPPAVALPSEPDPVAVSALAHLDDPAPPRPDADATGLRPAEPDEVEATPDPPSRRGTWIGLAAVTVAALVAGLLIGLLGGGDDGPRAAPRASGTGRPTESGGVFVIESYTGAVTGTQASPSVDPGIAPRIIRMERIGKDVLVVWTDPTNGNAPFVLNYADPRYTDYILRTSAGVTRVTLQDFPTGRHCVRVTSVTSRSTVVVGPSAPRCVS